MHEVVDERHVPRIHIPDYADMANTEPHRYPFAGAANAVADLKVLSHPIVLYGD